MAELDSGLAACIPQSGPIRAYLEWACPLSHAPAEMVLAALLPLASYEMCRRGFIVPAEDFGHPRLWLGVVAPSSVSKTSTVSRVKRFSRAWRQRCFGDGVKPHDPWVSLEGSPEGATHVLCEMPQSNGVTPAILWHSEFDRVLRSESASSLVNMLYDGEVERNLRHMQKQAEKDGSAPPKLDNGAFSAIVTTTPVSFERSVKAEAVEGGLFYRFLWVRTSLREFMPLPKTDKAGLEHTLAVWEAWFRTIEGHRLRGVSTRVRFTYEAAMWFEHEFGHKYLGPLALSGSSQAPSAVRAMAKVAHLASVYAFTLARFRDGFLTVELEDVQQAARFVMYCIDSARQISVDATTRLMEHSDVRRTIMAAVWAASADQSKPFVERGLSRGEIYKLFNNKIRKGVLEETLASMQDGDEILEVVTSPKGRVGRPKTRIFSHALGERVFEMLQAAAATGRHLTLVKPPET